MSQDPAMLALTLAGFGMSWIVQSSVLLGLGLAVGYLLRRSGPAVQSGVYRTTLAAVLVCPVAARVLASTGVDGLIPESREALGRRLITVGLADTLLASLLGVGQAKQAALAQGQNEAKAAEAKIDPGSPVIRGQVVGPDGKPVPGATVTASCVRPGWMPEGIGDSEYSRRPREIIRKTADGDGHFEIAFEPAVADRDGQQKQGNAMVIATAPGFGLGYCLGDKPIRLFKGNVPINGRVVDLEGRPIAQVKVRIRQLWVLDEKARRKASSHRSTRA